MTHFATTFGGYDRGEVDAFVAKTHDALESGDPGRRADAVSAASAVTFHTKFRGYDRANVDRYLRRVARGRGEEQAE